MNKKKIAILRSKPLPDSRVEKEANSLIRHGHDVIFIAWNRDANHPFIKRTHRLPDGELACYYIGIRAPIGAGARKNFLKTIRFQLALMKSLFTLRNDYNCIHACDLDTGFTGIIAALFIRKKLVYDIFDYYPDSRCVTGLLRRLLVLAERFAINKADAVIICSEKRKEQISGSKPKRLAVIHNSPVQIHAGMSLSSGNPVKVAYVGLLSKNDRYLEEMAEFFAQHPEYELHIAGYGILAPLMQEYAKKYSNIFFYGTMDYAKVLDFENTCDILTALYRPDLPNHYYAAPNKFYEALMLGKPLIMIENTGMDHFVSKYDIGEVLPLKENADFPVMFERAMLRLVSRRDEWDGMGRRMKEIYSLHFSWEEMERRLLELYDNI